MRSVPDFPRVHPPSSIGTAFRSRSMCLRMTTARASMPTRMAAA